MAKTINWEHKEPKRSTGDNLRRILKDKDAMLEVAKLAAEDQRKAMTNNTREVEEIIEELKDWGWNTKGAIEAFRHAQIEKIRETLHHQLQKAREERDAQWRKHLETCRIDVDFVDGKPQATIEALPSELDQDKK